MKPLVCTDEYIATFEKVMAGNNLTCSSPLIPDEKIHRFDAPGDRPKSLNAWYVLYAGPNPTIVFGSWKTGQKVTKSVKHPDELSLREREQHSQRFAQAKEQARQEQVRLQQDAAVHAQEIWRKAVPASTEHPYLHKKGIQAFIAKEFDGRLVVPVHGKHGVIATLQFIEEDGTKRFLPHGAKVGNYCPLGEPGDRIYLVEGYATGATVHDATGACTIVAFDAGNLMPVAMRLRSEYPHAEIIIAADNDFLTEGNPGLTKARQAAEAVGGSVVHPTFTHAPGNWKPPTDFNDLALLEGVEVVRAQLQALPEPEAWPDLIPLEAPSAPELPSNLFPDWLERMVEEVSQATETPRELAAALGLASVATACQGAFEIEIEPGYTEPLNLWINAAMDSGNRKTAVLHAMTDPLLKYEKEQALLIGPQRNEVWSKRKTMEERIKHLRGQAARAKGSDTFDTLSGDIAKLESNLPEVPVVPRLWVEDITPEKIGQVMDEHNGVLALLSDEGGVFENIAGRYNGGIPNLDIFLKSHSVSAVRIHRTSRESIMMDAPTLTIGVSPQPEILRGLVQKSVFRGTGFLARFLYVLPVSRLGWRPLEQKPVSQSTKEAYVASIHRLLTVKPPQKDDGSPSRYRLKLSDDARREWKDFQRTVESWMRDGKRFEHMKDWGGKLPGAAGRVAGLLHCATHANGEPWKHPVSLQTMEQTLDIMAVLAEHAIQAFELMAVNPDIEKGKKVFNWIQRRGLMSFTQRECYRELHGTFRRVDDLRPGLDVLVERGYIRQAMGQQKKNGRPSSTFDVNPALSQEGA